MTTAATITPNFTASARRFRAPVRPAEVRVHLSRPLRGAALADPNAPLPRSRPAAPPALAEEVQALRAAQAKWLAEQEQKAQADRAAWYAEHEARAAAERERVERALGELANLTQDLREQQRYRLEEMQQVAVELAVVVAGQLVHQQIAAGDFAVESLVRKAIERLETRQAVTVALHPDDIVLLGERLGDDHLTEFQRANSVTLVADESLARGDCRAETGDLTLVSQLDEQLDDIRRDLLEALPEAQVERRQRGSAGLARFPERRATA